MNLEGRLWMIATLMEGRNPVGLVCRLEAFYQHYARFALMDGNLNPPLSRQAWWFTILQDDLKFAVFVAVGEEPMPDAVGVVL